MSIRVLCPDCKSEVATVAGAMGADLVSEGPCLPCRLRAMQAAPQPQATWVPVPVEVPGTVDGPWPQVWYGVRVQS